MATDISNLAVPTVTNSSNLLIETIPQQQQNGGGSWGQLPSLQLPRWCNGPNAAEPYHNGAPWGNMNTYNTNPYTSAPNGQLHCYDFHVSECTIAPDGVQLENEVCINGQFPGPMIEANYGDWIEGMYCEKTCWKWEETLTANSVTVHNDLQDLDEGTSMHWHGLLQKETPWYDGIPAIGQCPIAPGHTYTYTFKADLYGTSWYHSHYTAQYAGGLQGPMIIYGPNDHGDAIDLGPVMLTDWYHNNYTYLVDQTMAPDAALATGGPNAPISNNNLINGKMSYDCSKTSLPCTPDAPLSKFNFTSGATHKLRLINTGSQAIQKFSIDGHNLTVVANDFVPVQPYNTDHVSLGVGQRADVLVNGTGQPGEAYWMRSNIKGCSMNDGISPLALAAIYYEGADTSQKPNTTSSVNDDSQLYCANDPLQKTIPTYEIEALDPAVTDEIHIELKSNGTHQLYYMNDVSFRADYNDPLLLNAHNGNLTFNEISAVHNYGTNSSVRLVVLNYDTQFHPMHLHGHNMQVLNVGFGPWDGKTLVRPSNPQRRDVQLMPPGSPTNPSNMVIQWTQDNPGMWPFHCHIAWHLSAGLYFNVLENPEAIQTDPKFAQLPGVVDQTCPSWNAFTSRVIVDQVDDGV